MSKNSTSTVMTTVIPRQDWSAYDIISLVINGVLCAVTIWILICTIVYGFRTNRWWNRPGTSSLSTGAIYTTCTIAIALKLPNYIFIQVWLYLGSNQMFGENLKCEDMVDSAMMIEIISFYAVYAFLWLLQRRILNHPYIKDRVNKYVDFFSRGIIFAITLLFLGFVLLFWIDQSGFHFVPEIGCVPSPSFYDKFKVIALAFSFCLILIQVVLFVLSMYAASRAIIPRASENDQHWGEEAMSFKDRDRLESQNCFQIFTTNVIQSASQENPIGPIHMAVKRSTICCIIITGSDVLLTLLYALAVPAEFQIPARDYFTYVQSCNHIFTMLAVFGFARKILTLCCPREFTIERFSRSRPGSVRPAEQEADVNTAA